MSNVLGLPARRPDLRKAFDEAMAQLMDGIAVVKVAREALDARDNEGTPDVAVETQALRVGLRLLDAAYNALDSALVRLANEGASPSSAA